MLARDQRLPEASPFVGPAPARPGFETERYLPKSEIDDVFVETEEELKREPSTDPLAALYDRLFPGEEVNPSEESP